MTCLLPAIRNFARGLKHVDNILGRNVVLNIMCCGKNITAVHINVIQQGFYPLLNTRLVSMRKQVLGVQAAMEYDLAAGQQLIVDTGNLAVMDTSCSIDIQSVKGVKNMIFGGEGLFNTVVTGPGRVYLQTMPISNVAGAIRPFIPTGN